MTTTQAPSGTPGTTDTTDAGSSPYRFVRVERDGATITITLARPEKRNALSMEVMTELRDAIREAGRTDALAVVLAAEGKVFSAGHNFGDMAGADLATTRALFVLCTEMMDAIQQIPQPVVAKVHALATAAGCQLIASCDLAIAARSAGFALPGGKGGLFCTTPLVAVSRNISRKRALELALTGDPIDAETAADWGLINAAVPDDELDSAVDDLVARVTRGSAYGRSMGKQAFYAQIGLDQRQAYDIAIESMAAGALTADAQEGFAAFLEKRHPEFTSKP
ncbi:enoyl-CoA hydratase-related protein [Mobilicoccus massiliensis]|uniref:enoyl-CoA hydratase-related protein n=1 Tax=Mobilicoccus massiliensis TaxID=1522310 RepID=UPI0009E563B9|nr:enoyl-CoA hydratase-related protein [Mobilicoccus massiliensis]